MLKQDGTRVGAISKAQIKSTSGPFGDKKNREKAAVPKKN